MILLHTAWLQFPSFRKMKVSEKREAALLPDNRDTNYYRTYVLCMNKILEKVQSTSCFSSSKLILSSRLVFYIIIMFVQFMWIRKPFKEFSGPWSLDWIPFLCGDEGKALTLIMNRTIRPIISVDLFCRNNCTWLAVWIVHIISHKLFKLNMLKVHFLKLSKTFNCSYRLN